MGLNTPRPALNAIGVDVTPMMQRRTITIMSACKLVSVGRRTIYNWLSSGKLEYVRTAGGSIRIYVDTLYREGSR